MLALHHNHLHQRYWFCTLFFLLMCKSKSSRMSLMLRRFRNACPRINSTLAHRLLRKWENLATHLTLSPTQLNATPLPSEFRYLSCCFLDSNCSTDYIVFTMKPVYSGAWVVPAVVFLDVLVLVWEGRNLKQPKKGQPEMGGYCKGVCDSVPVPCAFP